MAIIPHFFKNAVVPIGIKMADGSITWIGTGFFLTRKVEINRSIPFLITNKHVFEGKDVVTISMKENGTEVMKLADASLTKDGRALYTLHPNPQIDIAVLQLSADFIINNNLEFPSFDIDDHAMTSAELRDNGVEEGALIHMLGFTLGLVNEHSHYPLCRLGCISRISEAQIKEQYNILIDIQNFPGNSGSPIILRPDAIAIEGTRNLMRSVLVGIVHSYIPYEDKLKSLATNRIVELRTENSGIAQAHPVEFIREIIDKIVPKTQYNKNAAEGEQ